MGDYYEQRASAGLVITEGTEFSEESFSMPVMGSCLYMARRLGIMCFVLQPMFLISLNPFCRLGQHSHD